MMILVNNKHDFINKKIQKNKLSSIAEYFCQLALSKLRIFYSGLVWFGVQTPSILHQNTPSVQWAIFYLNSLYSTT